MFLCNSLLHSAECSLKLGIPKWLSRLAKTAAGRFWVMFKNQYKITDTILSYKYYLNKCWYLSSVVP